MKRDQIAQAILQAHAHKYPDGFAQPVDAAKILRMSPKTLATLRSKGGGPPWIKTGRYVFYPLTELAQWFAKRSVSRR